jgi:CDGSH-type Zn-finger protein
MRTNKFKIKVSKDGPYLVSGGVPLCDADIRLNKEGESLDWRKGDAFPAKETCALCRCGGSSNKPFCDGTHLQNEFDGAETAPHVPEPAVRIEGPALDLDDAEKLCSGARFCDRAGSIWKLVKQGDEESVNTATEEAANCPSGRLSLSNKKGQSLEEEFDPGISVTHDPKAEGMGPLWVKGGIPVEGADGEPYQPRNRATLCRCGKSKNKPFCDRSHLPPGVFG